MGMANTKSMGMMDEAGGSDQKDFDKATRHWRACGGSPEGVNIQSSTLEIYHRIWIEQIEYNRFFIDQ